VSTDCENRGECGGVCLLTMELGYGLCCESLGLGVSCTCYVLFFLNFLGV